ncbi:MAG: hypothetical protein LBE09_00650 [Christensenellaceae bacterium]|jgi:hypothetical protein|nr:hypothetical protein [Christensenellaceae bacterium]
MSKKSIKIDEKENKRLLHGLLFMLAVGIIFNAAAFGVFFGYCRPFEKFVYYQCVVWNKELFRVDVNRVKVVYYVDKVRYENELHVNNDQIGGGPTRVGFYYNPENPNDIMPYVRHQFLIAMPIIAVVGTGLSVIGIIQYKGAKRNLEKEKRNLEKSKRTLKKGRRRRLKKA